MRGALRSTMPGPSNAEGAGLSQPLANVRQFYGTTAPARTGDPQIHNLVL